MGSSPLTDRRSASQNASKSSRVTARIPEPFPANRTFVTFENGHVLHLKATRSRRNIRSLCGLQGGRISSVAHRPEGVQTVICKTCLRLDNA